MVATPRENSSLLFSYVRLMRNHFKKCYCSDFYDDGTVYDVAMVRYNTFFCDRYHRNHQAEIKKIVKTSTLQETLWVE